jgi:hypothetical protein
MLAATRKSTLHTAADPGLAVAQIRVHQPANGEIARPRDARHKLLARADGCYLLGLFAGWRLGHNGRRALIVPSRWITPPSIITPRSANKLKKAKQLSGTASASNKSRFMAKCVHLWLAAQPNSIPPRRSDNTVQKI